MRFLAFFCCLLLMQSSIAQAPDLILFNGKIFTSDTAKLYVEALAIKGNKIVATGTNASLIRLTGKHTRKINLRGKTVIPGINDAHYHISPKMKGRTLGYPKDGREPLWPELRDSLIAAVATTPRGEFIYSAVGVEAGVDSLLNRYLLDSIAPHHPVVLQGYWGHVTILNSAAIKALGIAENITDPPGGFYGRDTRTGIIDGRLYEAAQFYGRRHPLTNDSLLINSMQELKNEAIHFGITTVQNMCTATVPAELLAIAGKTKFPIRLRLVRWGLVTKDGNLDIPSLKKTNLSSLHYVDGTKWLLDGTPLERLAQMKDDYADREGWKGRMNFSAAYINKMIAEANRRNDPLMVHAVGDVTLKTFLTELQKQPAKTRRPRIEHGDGLMPELWPQAKKAGAIVVQNPAHFAIVPHLKARWKGETETHGQSVKSLLQQGIPVALGSDGPLNPYLNIMFAVLHPYQPKEAITVEEAVIAYTHTAAYAEFREKEKGTLQPGKLADLVVLSQDIFTVPPPQLPATHSLFTMVDGKILLNKL